MKKRITPLIAFFIFVATLSSAANADADLEKIKKNVPKLLGANNQGMEFMIGFVPTWTSDSALAYGGIRGIRIFIGSAANANVKVSVPGAGWSRDISVKPYEVKEIIIPYDVAQPSVKNKPNQKTDPAQIYPGRAVHVVSDAPIICYGLVRYKFTSDGFLAIPIHSLGKEYILASYTGVERAPDEHILPEYIPSYSSIVGAYDNTEVTFTVGGNGTSLVEIEDGKFLFPGESVTKILNKGDVWLIGTTNIDPDITGSHVVANKPVACFSGNFCANIPIYTPACDHIIEQDIPTQGWGSTYLVTPIRDRISNSVIRIFAGQPNAVVYRNGWNDQIASIPKKSGKKGEGWIEMRADEGQPAAVTILSKNKINVVQYNTGSSEDGVNTDPFMLSLIPKEQFQNSILFNTPGLSEGAGFENNYVNIVYKTTGNLTIPDDLEIGFTGSNGEISWEKIKEKFGDDLGYEFSDPTIDSPSGRYYCKQLTLPQDGIYRIRSNDKFAAYAYGASYFDSYGFPTSIATFDLERPDTIPPDVKYTIDCNGNVPDKKLAGLSPAYVNDLPDDYSLRSNMGVIYMDKENSYNYVLNYDNYIAGEDRYVEWSLTPINPDLDGKAVITFSDRAGNDTTIIIEHSAIKIQIEPATQDFGTLMSGESKAFEFRVINRSKEISITAKDLRLLKGNQGFVHDYSFNPDDKIAPGESRDFKVIFTATEEGEFSDSLLVAENCSGTSASFVFAKVEKSKILVSDVAFPKTSVGKKSDPIVATIRNVGSGKLKVIGFKAPSQSVFTTDLEALGISQEKPLELDVNNEAQFNIWFSPDADITYQDSIIFESGAGSVIDPVCLISGEGMQPALTVTNENWLRKRVHLPKYDAAPYNFEPYPAYSGGIKIANEGSQTATIKSVSVDLNNSLHPEAFKLMLSGEYVNLIDHLDIFARQLEVDSSVRQMVYFDPGVEGEHRLALVFESDAPTVTSVLEGVGIYPKIKTADVDFGRIILGDKPSRKLLRFTNENWGLYSDSLTISSFIGSPVGAITTTYDQSKPGSEGFAYNEQFIDYSGHVVTLPITLQPGQYVDIPAEFIPIRPGDHTAKITCVSDAEIDQTSEWLGVGVNEALSGSRDSEPSICHNDTAIVVAKFENTGMRDFNIHRDKLYILDDVSNSFSIIGVSLGGSPLANWREGFSLPAGKVAEVLIKYDPIAPTGATAHTAKVVLNTNAIDSSYRTITVPVSGRARLYELTTSGTLDGKESVKVKPDGAESYKYSIYVDGGLELSSVDITEYRVRVIHKRNFLDIRKDGGDYHIYKGDGLPGDWAIIGSPMITLDEAKNEQTIDVVLRGATKLTTSSAFELLKIEFFAFLPWFKDTETGTPARLKDSLTVIRHYVDDDEACVDYVTPRYPMAELSPVCAGDIRSIEISSLNYGLSKIVPNPIDARGGEIKFENAFDDEQVQLNVFNSNNELVATLVSGPMKAGKHSVRIPIETLSSGTYSYRLSAGPFKATEVMLIVK